MTTRIVLFSDLINLFNAIYLWILAKNLKVIGLWFSLKTSQKWKFLNDNVNLLLV